MECSSARRSIQYNHSLFAWILGCFPTHRKRVLINCPKNCLVLRNGLDFDNEKGATRSKLGLYYYMEGCQMPALGVAFSPNEGEYQHSVADLGRKCS